MKQMAGKEAVAYSLARGKAGAVTVESGEVVACCALWRKREGDGSHLHSGCSGTKRKHRNRC